MNTLGAIKVVLVSLAFEHRVCIIRGRDKGEFILQLVKVNISLVIQGKRPSTSQKIYYEMKGLQ